MNILVNVDLNDLKENEIYCIKPVEKQPDFSPLEFVPCGEWVSVNDRLPNEAQACYIKSDGKAVAAIALYKPAKKCWEVFPPAMRFTVRFVSHWMPIKLE